MPTWLWIVVGVAAWLVLGVAVGTRIGRFIHYGHGGSR